MSTPMHEEKCVTCPIPVHEEEHAKCLPMCMRWSVQCVYPCALGGDCNVSTFVHEEELAMCLPIRRSVQRVSMCMRRKVQRAYQ